MAALQAHFSSGICFGKAKSSLPYKIALQPGRAVWEAFHDPKDGKVKLEGESFTQFPQLPDFKQVNRQWTRMNAK